MEFNTKNDPDMMLRDLKDIKILKKIFGLSKEEVMYFIGYITTTIQHEGILRN